MPHPEKFAHLNPRTRVTTEMAIEVMGGEDGGRGLGKITRSYQCSAGHLKSHGVRSISPPGSGHERRQDPLPSSDHGLNTLAAMCARSCLLLVTGRSLHTSWPATKAPLIRNQAPGFRPSSLEGV